MRPSIKFQRRKNNKTERNVLSFSPRKRNLKRLNFAAVAVIIDDQIFTYNSLCAAMRVNILRLTLDRDVFAVFTKRLTTMVSGALGVLRRHAAPAGNCWKGLAQELAVKSNVVRASSFADVSLSDK